jgi:hypothetical protein
VIALRIDRDPRLLAKARTNLRRWRARFRDKPELWWQEWNLLLRRPWPEVRVILTDTSERATRLRQSSPFAGILSAAERRKIHDALRA